MAQDSLARRPVARQLGPLARVPATDEVEVLSTPEHLAPAAAAALGWDGAVLPAAVLLGRRVVVVAELDAGVHVQRMSTGWGPVTDRVSVATWDWPELAASAPEPAVRLRGVLAPARHWRTALAGAVPFAGLCPTAVLLPADVARDADCLLHAAHYGPSVVAAAGSHDLDPEAVDVVRSGRPGPAVPRPSAVRRWVHELVYAALLRQGA